MTTERAPRRLSRELRHERLLDATAELLVEHGADALTMEAIGQRAGGSKTLGYAYFPNLDAVVVSLRARELHRLFTRVEAAAAEASTFGEQVGAAVHAYFETVVESGTLLWELEQIVRARRISEPRGDGSEDLLEWLAHLIDGEFGVGLPQARLHAAAVGFALSGHGILWEQSGLTQPEMERIAVAFALDGLRAAISAGARDE